MITNARRLYYKSLKLQPSDEVHLTDDELFDKILLENNFKLLTYFYTFNHYDKQLRKSRIKSKARWIASRYVSNRHIDTEIRLIIVSDETIEKIVLRVEAQPEFIGWIGD